MGQFSVGGNDCSFCKKGNPLPPKRTDKPNANPTMAAKRATMPTTWREVLGDRYARLNGSLVTVAGGCVGSGV